MKIYLDKSSDDLPFIIICLFPVFLVISHFAPTKILKKRNYNKMFLILVQYINEVQRTWQLPWQSIYQLMVAMLSAVTNLVLGSLRLSQNSVQIDEAKFNVQMIFHWNYALVLILWGWDGNGRRRDLGKGITLAVRPRIVQEQFLILVAFSAEEAQQEIKRWVEWLAFRWARLLLTSKELQLNNWPKGQPDSCLA